MARWSELRSFANQVAESAKPTAASAFISPSFQREAWEEYEPTQHTAEVRFDSITLSGSPTSVTFAFWRLLDGRIDKMGTISISSTDVDSPAPMIIDYYGGQLYATVDSFAGGSAPSVSGLIEIRMV